MTPDQTEQAVFSFNLLNAFAAWAALAASATAVVKAFRRPTPLAEEVLAKFATKEDVKDLGSKLEGLRADIDQRLRAGDRLFRDIERTRGQWDMLMHHCPLYAVCRTGRVPDERADAGG